MIHIRKKTTNHLRHQKYQKYFHRHHFHRSNLLRLHHRVRSFLWHTHTKKNSSGKNWEFIFANRQFLEYFAKTNFREFVLFKYFAKTNFRELVTFKYFAKTYFREFRQNSRNSRKLILAKINPLKVATIQVKY